MPHETIYQPVKRHNLARKFFFGYPKEKLTCAQLLLEQTPTQYRHTCQRSRFIEALHSSGESSRKNASSGSDVTLARAKSTKF